MKKIDIDEINDNIEQVGQRAYSSAKALYEVNTNTFEQLFDQQLALVSLGLESMTSQMQLMGSAKTYKAIVSGQADIANDISNKSQGITRNTLDIIKEAKDDIAEWVEDASKEAAENVKLFQAA